MTKNEEKETHRISKLFRFERKIWNGGIQGIAGVDESGRGSIAGPVVAAAVIYVKEIFISDVNDSKKVSAHKREKLYDIINDRALDIGIGIIDSSTIDSVNIMEATFRAITIAISNLKTKPGYTLVDGRWFTEFPFRHRCIEGGDGLSFSIASGSIIAKVTRDRLMNDYDKMYPEYGFAGHKGYGTKAHIRAIKNHGFSPIHRLTFKVRGIKP